MTEGIFPKNSGDILYASEVNKFHGAGEYLGTIPRLGTVGSATAFIPIGSLVIGPGSLTNHCIIRTVTTLGGTDNGDASTYKMRVSGTALAGDLECSAVFTNPTLYQQKFTFDIGSSTKHTPENSTCVCETTRDDSITIDVIRNTVYYPSSGLVILYEQKNNASTGRVVEGTIVTFDKGGI